MRQHWNEETYIHANNVFSTNTKHVKGLSTPNFIRHNKKVITNKKIKISKVFSLEYFFLFLNNNMIIIRINKKKKTILIFYVFSFNVLFLF